MTINEEAIIFRTANESSEQLAFWADKKRMIACFVIKGPVAIWAIRSLYDDLIRSLNMNITNIIIDCTEATHLGSLSNGVLFEIGNMARQKDGKVVFLDYTLDAGNKKSEFSRMWEALKVEHVSAFSNYESAINAY